MEATLVEVFRATLADLPGAAELLRAQFGEHAIALDDRLVWAGLEGHLSDPARGAVLLARESEKVIGLAILALTWTVEHGGRVAWLEELYVVPSRRNAGIGKLLLEHAVVAAKGLGCRAIDLEVDIERARAEHLYERAGFHPLPRRRWALSLGDAGSHET